MASKVIYNEVLSKKMGTNDRPEGTYYEYYKSQGVVLKKKYGPK